MMSDHGSSGKIIRQKKVPFDPEEGSCGANDEVQMDTVDWLEYHDQANSLADIHKESLRAVFQREVVKPFKKKLGLDHRSHGRRTTAVVQQLHQIFKRTIENLTKLDTTMLKELQEKFPGMDEDWSHDACSIVPSSSSITGDIGADCAEYQKVRRQSCTDSETSGNGSETTVVMGPEDQNMPEDIDNKNGESGSEKEEVDAVQTTEIPQQDEGDESDRSESILVNEKKKRITRRSLPRIRSRRSARIRDEELEKKKKKPSKIDLVAIKKKRFKFKSKSKAALEEIVSDSAHSPPVVVGSDKEEEPEDGTADIISNQIDDDDEPTELQSQSLLETSIDMFRDDNDVAESNLAFHGVGEINSEEEGIEATPETPALDLGQLVQDNNYINSDDHGVDMLDLLGLSPPDDLNILNDETQSPELDEDDNHRGSRSPSQTVILSLKRTTSKSSIATTPIKSFDSALDKIKVEESPRNTESPKTRTPTNRCSSNDREVAPAENIQMEMDVNNGDEFPLPLEKDTVNSTINGQEETNNNKKIDSALKSVKTENTLTDEDHFFTAIGTSKPESSTVVIDDQKPSTSKKAVAELEKNHRGAKKTRENDNNNKGPQLSKEQEAARWGVLGSSSDEDGEDTNSKFSSPNSWKEGLKRKPVRKSYDNYKEDPKIVKATSTVEMTRLTAEIEKDLKIYGFIKLNNTYSEDDFDNDSDEDSDSIIRKLDRAIKELTMFNPLIEETSCSSSNLRKGKEQKTNKPPKQRVSDDSEEDELESAEDEENEMRTQTEEWTRAQDPYIPSHIIENIDSDGSDMEPTSGDNASSNKNRKSRDKQDLNSKSKYGSNEQKKYITPRIDLSSSDESGKENRSKALAKDSDDEDSDEDFESKKSKGGKKASSDDSDEDVVKTKKLRKKAAKINLLSDSDEDNSKDSKESEAESEILSVHSIDDSDAGKKMKKSKRKRRVDSSSDEAHKRKKKKSKSIKKEKDSDDSIELLSDDSDIQEVDVISASPTRKKIRDIMSNKDLEKSTKEAEKEEEERKKRVNEKQKLLNGMVEETLTTKGGASLKRLVLERDPETKEPVIEVEESIVMKLKPHQADGIKFMYTSCFESVEMIKKNKAGGCILAHCMGLGKTLQAVAFTYTVLSYKKLTGMKTALVVCPLNTTTNWHKEYKQWLKDTERELHVHDLWSGKTIAQRIDSLKTWQKIGGVGIIHYDLFRNLTNTAIGKGIGNSTGTVAQREAIFSNLLDPGPDMVICDEGHLLKNHKSKLTQALRKIKTFRRIFLTGTPLQNNLVEYHTMMDFVKPNLLGNLKEFKNRFVNPIKNGQCKDSSERDVKVMKRRAHVLHSKLDGCVQRLDYSVLTPYLPPKHEYCIIIKLSDKQKELYRLYLRTKVTDDTTERGKRLLQHYAVLIKILAHPIVLTMKKATADSDLETEEDGSLSNAETGPSEFGSNVMEWLDLQNKKKKATKRKTKSRKKDLIAPDEGNSNPSSANANKESLGNDWWSSVFQNKDEMRNTQLSGKLVVLQEILKICETIGDRLLIFSNYLTTLNIIEEFLAEWDKDAKTKNEDAMRKFPPGQESYTGRWRARIEYFRIDGSTKYADRQNYCDVFNKKSSSKAKLFLISTRAGGLGINLFGANRVVIFDASWNPSNDMQSIFRVFRFGQEKPCFIYRFVAQATMEEKIYNRQVVKLSLSSRVVDEHQVERHFKFDDINEMYKYNPDEKMDRPTPQLPKDRLLASLLISHKVWIDSYFEHDTLLVNKQDEELTEEERKQAWEEYRTENDRRAAPEINQQDYGSSIKIKARLVERFPGASNEQINGTAVVVLKKVNELKMMIHTFNMLQTIMSNEEKIQSEKDISSLQDWISITLNGTTFAATANLTNQQRQSHQAGSIPLPPIIRMPTMENMPSELHRMMMNSVDRVVNPPNPLETYPQEQSIPLPWPYLPQGPTNGNLGGPDSFNSGIK